MSQHLAARVKQAALSAPALHAHLDGGRQRGAAMVGLWRAAVNQRVRTLG